MNVDCIYSICFPMCVCSSKLSGGDFRLIYRHYATLYFVFCVDYSESELGILDLIQVSERRNCLLKRCTFSVVLVDRLMSSSIGICGDTGPVF